MNKTCGGDTEGCGILPQYPTVCAPTPAPMFSCNATVGRCVADSHGSQKPADCIDTCKCVTPHNCGQRNNTVACGVVVPGCNVCGMCCKPWIFQQDSCDGYASKRQCLMGVEASCRKLWR